jgi:hypothetical protein
VQCRREDGGQFADQDQEEEQSLWTLSSLGQCEPPNPPIKTQVPSLGPRLEQNLKGTGSKCLKKEIFHDQIRKKGCT